MDSIHHEYISISKGMIEALVTVEQLQIGTELDALNVENTTTLQGSVQQHRLIEKPNKSNRCSIWMRTKQYYKLH